VYEVYFNKLLLKKKDERGRERGKERLKDWEAPPSFYHQSLLITANHCKNFVDDAGHWWLMLVILATQEAEIRRVVFWSQTGQTVQQDPILKKPITKKGLVEWLNV
jgi:hypothetical protein